MILIVRMIGEEVLKLRKSRVVIGMKRKMIGGRVQRLKKSQKIDMTMRGILEGQVLSIKLRKRGGMKVKMKTIIKNDHPHLKRKVKNLKNTINLQKIQVLIQNQRMTDPENHQKRVKKIKNHRHHLLKNLKSTHK